MSEVENPTDQNTLVSCSLFAAILDIIIIVIYKSIYKWNQLFKLVTKLVLHYILSDLC